MRLDFWRQNILPIGLDLGRSGVKMLQLRSMGGVLALHAAARRAIRPAFGSDGSDAKGRAPSEGDSVDQIESRPALPMTNDIAEAIRAARTEAPFEGTACVCCPSASDLLIRAVRLPQMSDEELSRAVRWEAAERFEIPIENLEVEWVRAGEVAQGGEGRVEVIVIAAQRAVLETYLDAVLASGLCPLAVDAPFLAASRLLTRELRRGEDHGVARMTIDVGASATTVAITRGQQIAFLKSLDVGGEQFTAAIGERLNLDPEVARQLRIERMSPDRTDLQDDRIGRAAFEAVRPLLHELGQEAALCLRYYSVTFRGTRPTMVSIVGGEALEPGLAAILSEHLKIEARVVNPLEGIDLSSVAPGPERRDTAMTEWAVAAGLSMRGRAQRGAWSPEAGGWSEYLRTTVSSLRPVPHQAVDPRQRAVDPRQRKRGAA